MWGSAKAARCTSLGNLLLQEMPSSLAAVSTWICGASLNPVPAPGVGLTPRRSRTSQGWSLCSRMSSQGSPGEAAQGDLWVNAHILLLVPAVLLDFSLVEVQESN